MDGDDLESEPSSPQEQKSLAELFREVFPYYLAMGMTYDEFWYGNPSLVCDYRKAWEIKKQNEEWARWRQGAYIYDALLKVAPVLRPFTKGKVEAGKYPEEPWPMTEKEARDREEQRRQENFRRFRKMLEKESKQTTKKKQEVSDDADHRQSFD